MKGECDINSHYQWRLLWRGRSIALIAALAFGFCGCGGQTSPAPKRPPNIVLILSDDHGWSDFGFMGSEIVQTPQIDALAQQGVRFSLAFNTASVCLTSLRSILTGYHPAQYEGRVSAIRRSEETVEGSSPIRQIETLPRLLAERGYASFQGGKYWEGSYQDGGFTEGLAESWASRSSKPNSLLQAAGGDSLKLGRSTMEPLFEFIDENQERPFFVWFAPLLPHVPFDAPRVDRAHYEGAGLSEPAIGYYANISWLDRVVGQLVDHLERRNLREQTLIVFLTDNGWTVGEAGDPRQELWGGPEGKMSLHENGFRTPLILSWPGEIAPRSEDEHLVSTVDLFATLLDVAGVDRPRDRWGESLLPLLHGVGPFTRDRIMVEMTTLRTATGNRFPYTQALEGAFHRTQDWRYVRVPQRKTEALYSVVPGADPSKNVCGSNRKICDQMRNDLVAWQKMMNASPPADRELN